MGSMDEVQLKNDYVAWGRLYLRLQSKILIFVDEVLDKHASKGIDVEKIEGRGSIKSLEKIFANNKDPEKYNDNPSYRDLFDIKDVAGVRITVNCEDDLRTLATVLENEARQRQFTAVTRDGHGEYGDEVGSGNPGQSTEVQRRTSPFYDAIHITITESCTLGERSEELHCEIQIRTVLGDAWAVQDRKYIYGKSIAGESQELSEAISLIHRGCEKVWSLVRKNARKSEDSELGK